MDEGVIANATAESVLRLVPPLNIPEEDLVKVLDKLKAIISSIEKNEK